MSTTNEETHNNFRINTLMIIRDVSRHKGNMVDEELNRLMHDLVLWLEGMALYPTKETAVQWSDECACYKWDIKLVKTINGGARR